MDLVTEPLPVPAAITDPKAVVSTRKPDVARISVEQLFATRIIGGAAWSPDGSTIAFITNISGRNNLWLVPASGGWPVQLTVSDQRQASPAWSPDGKWIAFMSDRDGDEQWDIFVVSPRSGEVINLTKTPDVSEEDPVWSPDGRMLAYTVKPRESSTYEIHVMDISTRQVRHLTSGTPKEFGNFGPLWSPDGRQIAYTQSHATGKESNVFVADLTGGAPVNLTEHEGEHTFSAAHWSPDGHTLLITSDVANGYENVALLDIAAKRIRWLTHETWEIGAGGFSPDGEHVPWTANIDGNSEIFLYELASGRTDALPVPKGINAPAGAESAFSADGSKLMCYHSSGTSPTEIWLCDLGSGSAQQITNSLVGGLRADDMVEPQLVHYLSSDGRWEISAVVYVPFNLARDGANPAIVYVHGGPAAQSVNAFNRSVQLAVNRGYVVIAPNYRGSTGYGKAFHDANLFDLGGGDLQDALDAARWILRTGYVDPKRLIIMGASYGGYLTMMALTKAPDMWAAGIAIVPFVNWFTEIANEDPWLREYDLATMGDPVKNEALYRERSPINFVDAIRAPLLVLAGGNDPRCPKSEAEQVADAVRERNGVVELKIYEDEGHGFARIENQIDAYRRVDGFLGRFVP